MAEIATDCSSEGGKCRKSENYAAAPLFLGFCPEVGIKVAEPVLFRLDPDLALKNIRESGLVPNKDIFKISHSLA